MDPAPVRSFMVVAPAVFSPFKEAEATRRELQANGALRRDMAPSRTQDGVWFPVLQSDEAWDFTTRDVRPNSFMDLLDLNDVERSLANRAFEHLGDIAILKIPRELTDRAGDFGAALMKFLGCRAVFHDNGVVGEFRTRDLVLIAGSGGAETLVAENGFSLKVDVTRAYFSPRLATERARIVSSISPGQSVIDLFGGVAPLGVQAARAGASITSVDLNPDAIELAQANVVAAKVDVELICGDARVVGPTLPPADHVVMNLPHLAKEFISTGTICTLPGGTLHHHEIMENDALERRAAELVAEITTLGRAAKIAHTRHVRNYSPLESHYAIDLEIE